jgi:hypothetical protein
MNLSRRHPERASYDVKCPTCGALPPKRCVSLLTPLLNLGRRKRDARALTKKERDLPVRLVRWSVQNYIALGEDDVIWKRIGEKLERRR